MSLKLQQLQDELGDLKAVRFQHQIIGGEDIVICSYMVNDENIWERPHGLEARGITFRVADGMCISRPFEKFFNVGEREDTQPDLVCNQYSSSRDSVELTKKRDGSLITPCLIGDKVYLKSKKSFVSDVATGAQHLLNHDVPLQNTIKECIKAGFTPIFEFTSPNNIIVINYGDRERLTLLAIRNMETGSYCPQYDNLWKLFEYEAPIIERINPLPAWDELMAWQLGKEGEEGWVLSLDGKRMKLKTEWYLQRHRLLDVRYRDVADMVVDETLDDLIGDMIKAGKDVNVIKTVQKQVVADMLELNAESDGAFDMIQYMNSRKEQAMAIQGEMPSMMALAMARLDRNMDKHDRILKKMWVERYREKYPLRSIANPDFGNDDE